MRFLLVNPFYPISETPSPPLGLAFLAAALERAGIEVRVLDLVVYKYSKDRLETLLNEFRPDLVGSTAVTMTYEHAAQVIRDVKAVAPEIKTVMGGPHVSFRAPQTMDTLPELDFIVLGEGEEAVVELTRAVEAGHGHEKIQGLVFRNGREVVLNGFRQPGIEADDLPTPARHLLPLGRYRALGMAISMTTSRGCPFKCIFCVGRRMVGAKVRYRDPIKVVDEFEHLTTLGFPQINLADDLFTANKKHCHGVCDEIMRRGIKFKWTSFARVDTVSVDVLKKMKEAGCTAVSFGVETGNPEIMKTIKKGITLDQVVGAVEMCNEAGILPHASFILGLPGETPETIKETVAFGDRLNAMGVSHGFHLLAPFPGTLVRERAKSYGLKILTNDWNQYHANRSIVETETVTKEMMDEVVIRWEKQFDAYLGYIRDRMEAGLATEEEAFPLVNLERIMLIYDLMMEGTLDRVGAWPSPNGETEAAALETLTGRVAEAAGKPLDLVRGALEKVTGAGDLRRVRENGSTRWDWVDYLS